MLKKPISLKKFKSIYYNTFDSLNQLTPLANDSAPYINIQEDQIGLTSYRNAVKFEDLAAKFDLNITSDLTALKKICIDDVAITFLSPSIQTLQEYKTWADDERKAGQTSNPPDYDESIKKLSKKVFTEDTSATNGSSLSMLIEYKNYRLLFLGDSFPSDVIASLRTIGFSKEKRIKVNIVKVSHHGSKHNTSDDLLELIECDKFLISTNGKKSHHPDKESLARIITCQDHPCLIFNYDLFHEIFTEQELSSNLFDTEVKNEVELK